MWLLLSACAPLAPDDSAATCVAAVPVASAPVTTLTRRIEPDPALASPTPLDPAFPDGLVAAEALGLGGWSEVEGEPRLLRDELAPGHVPPASGRRSLVLFFHQTDAQIADAESPTRMVSADAIAATESAARPQELYAIHALDALIRTADALDTIVPVDFALATGDNADSVQANELGWFVSTWDGTPFRPDSAEPDSQLDADCNDPLAAFTPAGAAFPWYAVAGNHDVLVQGNFDPARFVDVALGDDAPMGTRDLSEPGGPLTYSAVPDPARAVMERSDIATVLLDSPATPGPVGHGFTAANVADDSAGWAATPVPGVPVLLVTVDGNPPDVGEAELTAAEWDGWLRPTLEAAQTAGQLVILASHYALGDLPVEGGGVLGDRLVAYPNVVLAVGGHSHVNAIRAFGAPDDPGAFYEIRTASSVDWPGQGRLVELVDNGDGTLSIFTTLFDYDAPPGSLAARARTLAAIDLQSGWRLEDGTGAPEDHNTELVQRLPEGWAGAAGTDGVRSEALP